MIAWKVWGLSSFQQKSESLSGIKHKMGLRLLHHSGNKGSRRCMWSCFCLPCLFFCRKYGYFPYCRSPLRNAKSMVDTPTYAFKMANAKLFFVGSWWPFGKAWRCMCFKQKENCKTTRNFRFFKFRPLYPSTPAQSSQMTILSLQAWLLLLCMPHSLGILPFTLSLGS